MAGVAGRSGRRKKPGKRYYLGYFRLMPGEDPPELENLLNSIIEAKGRKRRDILRAALLGGSRQAEQTAAQAEDSEAANIFEDMFGNF